VSLVEILLALTLLSLALVPILGMLGSGHDEVENADRLLELLDRVQSGSEPAAEERSERGGTLVVREHRASREAHRLWWFTAEADPAGSFAPLVEGGAVVK
jgi:hypothetical protein